MSVSFNQPSQYPVSALNVKSAQKPDTAAKTSFKADSKSDNEKINKSAQKSSEGALDKHIEKQKINSALIAGSGVTLGGVGGALIGYHRQSFFKDGVPSDEFCQSFIDKYPFGKKLPVIYEWEGSFIEKLPNIQNSEDLAKEIVNVVKEILSLVEDKESLKALTKFNSENVSESLDIINMFPPDFKIDIDVKELEQSIKNGIDAVGFDKFKKRVTDGLADDAAEIKKRPSSFKEYIKERIIEFYDLKTNKIKDPLPKGVSVSSAEKELFAKTVSEFNKKAAITGGLTGAAVLGGATALYCYFKNKSAAPETQKLDAKV